MMHAHTAARGDRGVSWQDLLDKVSSKLSEVVIDHERQILAMHSQAPNRLLPSASVSLRVSALTGHCPAGEAAREASREGGVGPAHEQRPLHAPGRGQGRGLHRVLAWREGTVPWWGERDARTGCLPERVRAGCVQSDEDMQLIIDCLSNNVAFANMEVPTAACGCVFAVGVHSPLRPLC